MIPRLGFKPALAPNRPQGAGAADREFLDSTVESATWGGRTSRVGCGPSASPDLTHLNIQTFEAESAIRENQNAYGWKLQRGFSPEYTTPILRFPAQPTTQDSFN